MFGDYLQEPIIGFVQQWPFIAVLSLILWFMRKDLLACIEHNKRIMDELLKFFRGD